MPRSLLVLADNMMLRDDPDHRRLRRLVDKAFHRRSVEALRPRIAETADRLLDTLDMSEGDVLMARSRGRCHLPSSASCSACRPRTGRSSPAGARRSRPRLPRPE
jgi:hypothetical protein